MPQRLFTRGHPQVRVLELECVLNSEPLLVLFTQIQRCAVNGIAFNTRGSFILTFQFRPLNTDLRIVPSHTAFIVWMVEIIAEIAELCHITQHQKTVRKSARNKELMLVFFCKDFAVILSIG